MIEVDYYGIYYNANRFCLAKNIFQNAFLQASNKYKVVYCMLKTRLITGLILSFLVIYILSFSSPTMFGSLFVLIVTISITLAGTEFAAMRWIIMDGPSRFEQPLPQPLTKHFLIGSTYGALVFIFYICSLIFKENIEKGILICIGWVFLCLFMSTALIYRTATDMHTASNKLLNITAGFIYLALPGCCLVKLSLLPHQSPYRGAVIYFCMGVVLMGDVAAYFVGTKYGKHKLIPKVSPKKSIEGALAGLVASGLTAVSFAYFFELPYPIWYCLIVGIASGIAGQIGDLMESAFKRAGGFKDSGKLLPGHGGFLDRIDSLILSAPVTYIFFSLYL